MPRNSSGTMTLPSPGVPFQSGQTISSAQVNATFADVATEISDSASRSGKGGFSAPVRVPDGTAAAPAYAFGGEINSGWYRAGANDVRLAVGGVDVFTTSGIAFPTTAGFGPVVSATGANKSVGLQGNRAAADTAAADVVIGSTAARTAGLLLDVQNPVNGASKLNVDYQGLLRLAAPAAAIQPASIWTALALNAGWSGSASYMKDATGAVRVEAFAVFSTGAAAAVFNLPVGFRADPPYMPIVDFSALSCVPALLSASTGAFTIPNPVNAHGYQIHISFIATA